MKRLLQVSILAVAVTHFANAQKSPIKFGNIPMEDLTMTTYPQDSSAEAVILADYCYAAMNFTQNGVKLNVDRHVRIKILKKEGLGWADAGILLYKSGSSEERAVNLKASTYNLDNGKIVESKVSKDGIFKEKFNKRNNIQKFTFPNVKKGSIVEYSYTISSDFIFNFPDFKFQHTIPSRHTEFWAIIPDFCKFQKYMKGYLAPQYEIVNKNFTDYQAVGHHWTMKDVPAFKKEPYMTSEEDYLSRVNFAISHLVLPGQPTINIMDSWEKLVSNLLDDEDFGRVINGNGFLKKTVESLTAGMTDDKVKADAIYNYIKKNIEWDGISDIYAEDLNKVFEAKKGSSADINLGLASMLSKAKIPVDMVLLSTREHGFVREQFPMASQFDYVVCRAKIGEKYVLLDATETYLPAEVLPERCLNGQGLIVSKVNFGWVSLDSKGKSKTIVDADFALDQSGSLKGKLNYTRTGYAACEERKQYNSNGADGYWKQFRDGKTWEISNSLFENPVELEKPAIQKHELTLPTHAAVTGNIIYLMPIVTEALTDNPFKADTRQYPVDFGAPEETMYVAKFSIPEGFKAEEIPQNKIIALPANAGKFVYSVTVSGNLISVVSTVQINKSLFVQNEYPLLREFYNQIVAKQSEQVVLKKL
jgi:hypothetical protein